VTPYLLFIHLVSFLAPAACMALALLAFHGIGGLVFKQKRPLAQSIPAAAAIIFIAGSASLLAGLVLLGKDGKMASYGLMVFSGALCWTFMRRG
jgi:hypothetical protein